MEQTNKFDFLDYNLEELLSNKKLSDGMRQYLKCKKEYNDCIVLHRMGDFYELFFEDALKVYKPLNLTLTSKNCGLEKRAPMCGVPVKALNSFVQKLIPLGYKIAIAEQLQDPKESIGVVDRDVVRIITPGTIIDDLQDFNSNYLMAIYIKDNEIGLSYIDINEGDIYSTKTTKKYLISEISKVRPNEIIFNDTSIYNDLKNILNEYNIFTNEFFEEKYLEKDIIDIYFDHQYLNKLNLNENPEIENSLAILLHYIEYTQKRKTIKNMNSINIYNIENTMILDAFTRNNLDITTNQKGDKSNTLYNLLDKTNTAMGSRLLNKIIKEPLIDKEDIEERLNIVEDLYKNNLKREEINTLLKNVYDLERICSKLAFEKANARDLLNLKNSIQILPALRNLIDTSNLNYLKKYVANFDILKDIFELIEKSILETAELLITEGNIIKPSYNETLKKYKETLRTSTDKILELEDMQQEKLKNKKITIKRNGSDGYFLEFTKKTSEEIILDDSYKKVRDLTGAFRYTFPELRQLEIDILEAEKKSNTLEYEIFTEIREIISNNIYRIKKTAKLISYIDVFCSLAQIAIDNNYIKPIINENNILDIKDGRHPIVEDCLDVFTANDSYMNHNEEKIHIITGPNMAGKSTYMRQVVLINLMAQIGSFVPCSYANVPIRDKIFTRIGASDNLAKGQSTFMVEMVEVSQILKMATEKSLVILDEVGRGTSIYDGISLAYSIVKYIEEHIKCHTLFATHYFELIELEKEFNDIKNYTIQIEENENTEEIKFLRKIVRGYSTKSYGIHIAQYADLPKEVITEANKKLNLLMLEQKNDKQNNIINELQKININNISPMEALKILNDLQNLTKR